VALAGTQGLILHGFVSRLVAPQKAPVAAFGQDLEAPVADAVIRRHRSIVTAVNRRALENTPNVEGALMKAPGERAFTEAFAEWGQ
jgi:hypothetical protein